MASPRAFPWRMINLQLRRGVSFCELNGEFIFLDKGGGRYFALPTNERLSFARLLASQRLSSADRRNLTSLVSAGLLCTSSDGHLVRPCGRQTAARSLIHEAAEAPRRHVAHILARIATSALSLRTRSFGRVLDGLAARKTQKTFDPCADVEALRAIASAFTFTALIANPRDRCLPRSIALAHTMIDRGILPELVVGVRLRPFSAHCWIEHGDMLVNETLDHAREFTPILVV